MEKILNRSDLLLQIQRTYADMSAVEQRFSDFIRTSIDDIPDKTVTELSDICGVSEASIIRFAKKMGYQGFHQMKIEIARSMQTQPVDAPIGAEDTVTGLMDRSLSLAVANIRNTYEHLEVSQLEKAVRLISDCDQVLVFAAGNSLPVCHDFVYRLGRIGIRAICSELPELALLQAQNMKRGDIAFAFSQSGESVLVNEALQIVSGMKLPVICMSNYLKSPIMKWADVRIITSVHHEMFEGGQSQTRLTEYAVFDLLFYMLFFTRKDLHMEMLAKIESDQSIYSI